MSAAPKLEIFENGKLLQEIPLQGEMWVGRDEACVIHLNDRAISRKHGVIRATEQGGIEFESRSKFGWVKVNGQEQSQAILKDGDRVEVGPYELRVKGFHAVAEEIKANTTLNVVPVEATQKEVEIDFNSDAQLDVTKQLEPGHELDLGIEPGLPSDATPLESSQAHDEFSEERQDGATKVIKGKDSVKPVLFFGPDNANVEHFELNDQEISIGRSQQCNVVISDKRSSRKHATIRKENNTYILKDLGSANGTLVNDVRLDGEVELNSGDRIQIGDSAFTFQMVQADYQERKNQFIPVPEQEMASIPSPIMSAAQEMPSHFGTAPETMLPPEPNFEPQETPKKKSLLGPLIQRYRMMSTKQQIIWGLLVFGALYMFLEDEPEAPTKQVQTVRKQKSADGSKVEKITFETLTPEQQRYVESQYQLGFDNYKNREFDKAIFEIEKIFSLVHDYKQAREIYSYATEGKRKLETLEEERKRKEKEVQDKEKLNAFLDQAGSLMERRKYSEAEQLFPEIELLEPENNAVSAWRKVIASENERLEEETKRKQIQADLRRAALKDIAKAKALFAAKSYYPAIELYEDILDRNIEDRKFNEVIEKEVANVYETIASERDPLIKKGKDLEEAGSYTEAYSAYSDALKIDPDSEEAPKGMNRIRGTLQAQAKSIYTEGVFAESFNDFDTAEKRYREVIQVVPKEDDYYSKATARLKKITVFRRPSAANTTGNGSTGNGGNESIPQ